ncbi:hypothetical protein [Longispora urticae]
MNPDEIDRRIQKDTKHNKLGELSKELMIAGLVVAVAVVCVGLWLCR